MNTPRIRHFTSPVRSKALMLAVLGLGAAQMHAAQANEEIIEDRIETHFEEIRLVRITAGLEHPWGLAFLPDDRMLVTERPGRMNLVEDGEITEISGVPEVYAENQGGLLDVILHPEFEDNGWVFFTYSTGDAQGSATALGRGRLMDDSLEDVEELFVMNSSDASDMHYGSRIAFLPDGTLLMTVGDRYHNPERAQDPSDHAGSTLRLNDDGSAPDDNPFVDEDGFAPEIWSYGHRNVQAMLIHPETDEVWQAEHGARGGDILNRVEAGKNYGWPELAFSTEYQTQEVIGEPEVEGMEQPVIVWGASLGPSGLAYHDGDQFSNWAGDLFVGSLVQLQVRRVMMEDNAPVYYEEELIRDEIGRIRDVRSGPDGNLYLLTDEEDGGIYRLEPAD